MKSLLPAALAVVVCGAGQAQAAIELTAVQTGGSVVISGGGSINYLGLSSLGTIAGPSAPARILPNPAQLFIGAEPSIVPPDNEFADHYATAFGPANFGPGLGAGAGTSASLRSGDYFGIAQLRTVAGGELDLIVPLGYVSGDPLSASMTFPGETFASLGMSPGRYTWNWGSDRGAPDSWTLVVVPEPATSWCAMIALLTICGGRSGRAQSAR